MRSIALFMLWTLSAGAAADVTQNPPLRTVHGTVVDAKGKTVTGSIVYLHNEQTRAVSTHVTDRFGRFQFSGIRYYTNYRIHAQHNDLQSAVHKIPAHSTEKVVKLELKLNKKNHVATITAEDSMVSVYARGPNDRPSKRLDSHAPTSALSIVSGRPERRTSFFTDVIRR